MVELSDSEILKLFRNNKKEIALIALIDKYKKKLYWHIRYLVIDHEDTDDLLQEVFIKVWNNIDSFRGDSSLYTWLYRIATNEALNLLKKKRRIFLYQDHEDEGKRYEIPSKDYIIDGEKIQEIFLNIVQTLPEKQRLIFNMKYFEDLKYEEISEILGMSVGAAKASFHHAVKKIENQLSKLNFS